MVVFSSLTIVRRISSSMSVVQLCTVDQSLSYRFRSATGFSGFFLGTLHEGKKDHWTDHKEQQQQVPHLSGSNDWNPRIGRCFDQGIQARMIGARATANLGCKTLEEKEWKIWTLDVFV